ncbi:MAG: CoA transferase [Chloroflexi bacterium]|nr:CoA transferase [Chloroflexota bacterium]
MHTDNVGPLAGFRVLDLSDDKGAYCGKALGDLGADVIKIEPPGGDPSRWHRPFYRDQPDPERSLYWFVLNTSKRSITLDLACPDGQDLFRQLVAGAHAVVESYSPGYLDSLGLGYDQLRLFKRDIVLTSISPFGQSGPYRDYQATNLVAQAMGGLVYLCGDVDHSPVMVGGIQGCFQAGLQGALGTLFALYHQEETGQGQQVDVSMQEAITGGMWVSGPHQFWDLSQTILPRWGIPYHQGPLMGMGVRRYQVFRVRDGYMYGGTGTARALPVEDMLAWMARRGVGQELHGRQWSAKITRHLNAEDRDTMEAAYARFVATYTKAEIWEEALAKRIDWHIVQTPQDLFECRHLAERGFWSKVDHPELGEAVPYQGWPTKMGAAPAAIHRRPPLIGEHNQEIYVGELGLSRHQLAALKQAGVV